MKKLREYIELWRDGKKVRGINNVTQIDIDCCAYVYNGIVRGQKPEFINAKVKEILDKCGIKTIEHEVGWKVA